VLVDCEGDPEQIETSKLIFTGATRPPAEAVAAAATPGAATETVEAA
jgi:hypothetical protein